MKRVLLSAFVLVVSACALPAQELPGPLPTPKARPFVPEGERAYYNDYRHAIPATRHWVFWHGGGLKVYNTSESVGDGSAMKLVLAAGEKKSGWLVGYDTGPMPVKRGDEIVSEPFKEYKGICLWIRGDGSDAQAVFTTSYGDGSKNFFRVPLKDATWHKVFMSWDKWEQPLTAPFWFLTYGIERTDDTKTNWFIVDRVHLYKEEKVEEITPTPDNDPPGHLPARAFTSGRENIAKTLAELKAKEPVKIVVAGDSIVACAQMGYIRKSYKEPNEAVYPYSFWAVLCERLKADYGYDSASWTMRTYNDKKKEWFDQTPREDAPLQVIAVARGGWEGRSGLEHIQQILDEKPDLVVWEYGANETINGHMTDRPNLLGYVSATDQAAERLRAAGIEVVVQTVTAMADINPKGWLKIGNKGPMTHVEYAAACNEKGREIAKDRGCAVADVHAAEVARGVQFIGALHSDFVHLNHYGQALWADVLEALLTDKDVRTWTHIPPAEAGGKRME